MFDFTKAPIRPYGHPQKGPEVRKLMFKQAIYDAYIEAVEADQSIDRYARFVYWYKASYYDYEQGEIISMESSMDRLYELAKGICYTIKDDDKQKMIKEFENKLSEKGRGL